MLKKAISLLAERNPLNWKDQCAAVWTAWKQNHPTFDPLGVEAIASFIETLQKEQETKLTARRKKQRKFLTNLITKK